MEIVVPTEDTSTIYPWEVYEIVRSAFREKELLLIPNPMVKVDSTDTVFYLCEWTITDIDKRIMNGEFQGKHHILVK